MRLTFPIDPKLPVPPLARDAERAMNGLWITHMLLMVVFGFLYRYRQPLALDVIDALGPVARLANAVAPAVGASLYGPLQPDVYYVIGSMNVIVGLLVAFLMAARYLIHYGRAPWRLGEFLWERNNTALKLIRLHVSILIMAPFAIMMTSWLLTGSFPIHMSGIHVRDVGGLVAFSLVTISMFNVATSCPIFIMALVLFYGKSLLGFFRGRAAPVRGNEKIGM